MVYDTTATFGSDFLPVVDTTLGEGRIQMDLDGFNVWMWNWDLDSTKTIAFPYSSYPIFDATIINAFNWTPPMTIRWDTSLFHVPYLPFEQGDVGIAIMDCLAFFAISNHPELGAYDMLIDDSVTVDQFSEYLFPFSVYFGADDHVDISTLGPHGSALSFSPNPAKTFIHVQTDAKFQEIYVLDLVGRVLMTIHAQDVSQNIDISMITPGIYILSARTPQNQTYHGTFQKID